MLLPVQLAEASTPIAVTMTTPHPMAIWRMPRTDGARYGPAAGQALEGDDHQDGRGTGRRGCGRAATAAAARAMAASVAGGRRPGLRGPLVEARDLRPHVGDRRRPPGRRAPARPRRRAGRSRPSGEHHHRGHRAHADRTGQLGDEPPPARAHVEPALDGQERERGERPAPRTPARTSSTAPAASSGEHRELARAPPAAPGACARGSARAGGRPPRPSTGSGRGTRPSPRARCTGRPRLGATSSPSTPGSSVRPQPPCSAGSATDRHGERAAGRATTSAITVTGLPTPAATPGTGHRGRRADAPGRGTTGGAAHRCLPGRRPGPRARTGPCRRAPRSPRSRRAR